MIKPDRVAECLRPYLGSAFVAANPSLMEKASMTLFAFRPEQDSFLQLAQRLDNLLFMAVREQTSARMVLEMDNEQLVRLRISDFAVMADELLYLLFETMETTPRHQAMLRDYSMRNQSLTALKALYLHYQEHQSPEETLLLRRIITTSYPSWRYRTWMDYPQ